MNNELKVNIINDYEMLIDKYARMFYYNNAKIIILVLKI